MKVMNRVNSYINSGRGEAFVKGLRKTMPLILFVLFVVAAQEASAAEALAGTINEGFVNLFNAGKLIVGGLALAMAGWWGFKWIGGDPESMKKCIGTGIAGMVVINLDAILKVIGLKF